MNCSNYNNIFIYYLFDKNSLLITVCKIFKQIVKCLFFRTLASLADVNNRAVELKYGNVKNNNLMF